MVAISSCSKDKDDSNNLNEGTGFTALNISPDFKFESTKVIDVNIDLVSTESELTPYRLNFYLGHPDQDGKLFETGITEAGSGYKHFGGTIKIPTAYERIYIKLFDIYGGSQLIDFPVDGNSIAYEWPIDPETKAADLKAAPVDEGCAVCDVELEGTDNNLQIENGKKYCVKMGKQYTCNNVNFKGGKLVICGRANMRNVNGNNASSSLSVSYSGTCYIDGFNAGIKELVNFGYTRLNSNYTSSAVLYNYGTMDINGALNNSKYVYNYNYMQIGLMQNTSLNNNGYIYNLSEMLINGNLNNTADFANMCKLKVTGHFNQNDNFVNYGYVDVAGTTTLNGNTTTYFEYGSYMKTENLIVNSVIEGPTFMCARIDVNDNTNINGSGVITGNMDICDANGIENNNGTMSSTFMQCSCYIAANGCTPSAGTPEFDDCDGDGTPDEIDDDPCGEGGEPGEPGEPGTPGEGGEETSTITYYPAENQFTSLAFEDLWNEYGDYDFNDLVVAINYAMHKNAQNEYTKIVAKYHVKCVGATLNNGFGILLNTLPSNIESVEGNVLTGSSSCSFYENGAENGGLNQSIIIMYDAINDYLGTSMVNTIPEGNAMEIDTITVTINFAQPVADLGTAPFNPFMVVGQQRSKEIHLIDNTPSELFDFAQLGKGVDDSDQSLGRYFVSETNLPWAIEIPTDFEYPIEYCDITNAYLKFKEWAESAGTLYPDWYENNSGYRNASNIYQK